MSASTQRPLPVPTAETEHYWQAALEGRLEIQHCRACARHQFYPRRFCTECLSTESLEWTPSSGRGLIYSFTVCHVAAHPAFESLLPYAVAMVELEEGVRLLAGIVDSPLDGLVIGARVAVCFERINEAIALPMFRLLVLDDTTS